MDSKVIFTLNSTMDSLNTILEALVRELMTPRI